jgi:hypothetical protein
MSDSTNTIDEKKEENNGNSGGLASNIGKFLKSVFSLIILIIIYFAFSGLVLYGCKVGQANILPTDDKCYPYNDLKPNIDNIPINIFNTFTDPPLSMKINFPYTKFNSSNMILDLFRNYKEEPKSNFLANYFISIIENLLQFNYSSFNFVLNKMNSLPEIIVVLFGPILISIIAVFIFLFDHLYLIYLWFANMGWFFKHNSNSDWNHKPEWTFVTVLEPIDYWCAVWLVILFCILFLLVLFSLPVLPFITMCITIFTSLSYTAVMNNKSVNCLTIIKDLFKYYKVSLMSIFSFFVVISAFSNLGTIQGMFAILVLALIYWGIISIDLFKAASENNLTKLVSYDQAAKVCNFKTPHPEDHGLLYDLVFGKQSGGGNIKKELKKLGKKLQGTM